MLRCGRSRPDTVEPVKLRYSKLGQSTGPLSTKWGSLHVVASILSAFGTIKCRFMISLATLTRVAQAASSPDPVSRAFS